MKKLIAIIATLLICSLICSCSTGRDYVDIHNKSTLIFDNIGIVLPDGYFYTSHDKVRVDDNNVDLVIHFSAENCDDCDEWTTMKDEAFENNTEWEGADEG